MIASPEQLELFKRLTITALMSDETLMGILVLKGGNALNIAYEVTNRGSIDIDFSMEGDFNEKDLSRMRNQVEFLLDREFKESGYKVFDVLFKNKPKVLDEELREFWGGYMIEFKIVPWEQWVESGEDVSFVQSRSLQIGQTKDKVKGRFTVDISKYEYVGSRKLHEIDGALVQVYSPEMILLEKLRAICQQFKEYEEIVKSRTLKPRARDFYDIIQIKEGFKIDFFSETNLQLLKYIFEAKRVPTSYLLGIENYREFHRDAWISVVDTVEGLTVEEYDEFFDRVRDFAIELHDKI